MADKNVGNQLSEANIMTRPVLAGKGARRDCPTLRMNQEEWRTAEELFRIMKREVLKSYNGNNASRCRGH